MQESENGQNNCLIYMGPASCSTDTSSFYYSEINLFLIDDTWCKLSNIWLLLCENNTRSITMLDDRSRQGDR